MDLLATQLISIDESENKRPTSPPDPTKKIHQVAVLQIGKKKYPIFEGINVIGRSLESDICIENNTVSKTHAEIEANPKSAFVCDLNSSNKTRLNEEIIKPNRYYQVVDGSQVTFGTVNGYYFLLRDCDDSIIVPESPVRYRRYCTNSSSPSTSRSSKQNSDNSCKSSPVQTKDDNLFIKPIGVSSPRAVHWKNKVQACEEKSIHDIETQRLDQADQDKSGNHSIFECETQGLDTTSNGLQDLSIHEVETQKVDSIVNTGRSRTTSNTINKTIYELETQMINNDKDDSVACDESKEKNPRKRPYIHDIETQKIGDDDSDDVEMETPQPPRKARKTGKSIHNLETQIIRSDDEFDSKPSVSKKLDICDLETQRVVNDDLDESIFEMETEKLAKKHRNSKEEIHDVDTQMIIGDSVIPETDDEAEEKCGGKEINIHDIATQQSNDTSQYQNYFGNIHELDTQKVTDVVAATDSDTDDGEALHNLKKVQGFRGFSDKVSNDSIKSGRDSPVLANINSNSRFADEEVDLSLLPTQIVHPTKPTSSKDISNPSTLDDSDMVLTQLVDNPASKDPEKAAKLETDTDKVADLARTQVASKVKKNFINEPLSTDDEYVEPTQIAEPPSKKNESVVKHDKGPIKRISRVKKTESKYIEKFNLASSSDEEYWSESTPRSRLVPPKKQTYKYNTNKGNSSASKKTLNLNDSIAEQLDAIDGGNDKKMEDTSPLLTQQLVEILEPPEESQDSYFAKLHRPKKQNMFPDSNETPDSGNKFDTIARSRSKEQSDVSDDIVPFNLEISTKSANVRTYAKKTPSAKAPKTCGFKEALSKGPVRNSAALELDSSDDDVDTAGILKMADHCISDLKPNSKVDNMSKKFSPLTTATKKPRKLKNSSDFSDSENAPTPKKLGRDIQKETKPRESMPSRCISSPVLKSSKKKDNYLSSPRRTKHIVAITGISADSIRDSILQLGGSIIDSEADDLKKATVLITDKVRRTNKFFFAISKCIPIVSLEWVKVSQSKGYFVDPEDYILKDPEAEAKWGFNLRQSLAQAKEKKLFNDYTIILTDKLTNPSLSGMRKMIEDGGGRVLVRAPKMWLPNTVIVSCEADFKKIQNLMNQALAKNYHVSVVEKEFILTGILQQELDIESHRLLLG